MLRLFIKLHVAAIGALLSRAFAHGTPSEVADKWQRNLGNAQTEMQAGVQRVTQAPGIAAAAKKQKWVMALQDSATQDKWERNVRAVSLGSWQQSMLDLGIARAAQGATQKKPKFEAAMTSLLPFIDSVRSTVRNMPDNTPQDREQRALAMMRGMRGYKRPASGG